MMSPQLSAPPLTEADMLLTVREVAERLAVSRRHVWRLISANELPSIKFGRTTRVRVQDLEEFVERHRA